jgi:hypothetical protein
MSGEHVTNECWLAYHPNCESPYCECACHLTEPHSDWMVIET